MLVGDFCKGAQQIAAIRKQAIAHRCEASRRVNCRLRPRKIAKLNGEVGPHAAR